MAGRPASACARELDGTVRPARVLAAFPMAAYVAVGDRHDGVVALVRPDALRLPNAVRLPATLPDLRSLVQPGDVGETGPGSLRVGDLDVILGDAWQPLSVRRCPDPAPTPGELSLLRAEPALRTRARDLAAALVAGDRGPLRDIVGSGPGLTPTGDDVVCGVALVLRAVGAVDPDDLTEALVEAGTRTTSLSASLLRCAAQGLGVPQIVSLVDELLDPTRGLAPDTVSGVHAIGHSSGRDHCAGIAGAADLISPTGRER
ncbi:hypothetical protein GCM10027418_13360 [Mariniluteicoccus endophyticus]